MLFGRCRLLAAPRNLLTFVMSTDDRLKLGGNLTRQLQSCQLIQYNRQLLIMWKSHETRDVITVLFTPRTD